MRLDLLLERPERPAQYRQVKDVLAQLKNELWCKGLTTRQALNILREPFERLLICFNEVDSQPYSAAQAHRFSIDGASFDVDNSWITVNLCDDLHETLENEMSSYEEFSGILTSIISHELVHRDQLLKTVHTKQNVPNPSKFVEYLKDHREIEAHAVQAALELLTHFSIDEAKSKLKKISDAELYSDALVAYAHHFDEDTPTWKRFIKKLYQVLDSPS